MTRTSGSRTLSKKPDDRPADAATLASMIRSCGLGEWSTEQARRWWADRKLGPTDARTDVPRLGTTVAVALDDRGR